MELRNTEKEVEELIIQYKSLSSKQRMLKDLSTLKNDTHHDSEVKEKVELMVVPESVSVNSSPEQILTLLNSMKSRIFNLSLVMDKFRQRMQMKDPVTLTPRYGQQTLNRVTKLLNDYDAVKQGVEIAFYGDDDDDISVSTTPNPHANSSLVQKLQWEIRCQQEQQENMMKSKQDEMQTILLRQQQAQQEEEQKHLKEQTEEAARMQLEREDLARRAEQARRERLENERRALETQARALQLEREEDEAFIASVPKGLNGVKEQLSILRQHCNKMELDIALGALHTLFSQINSKPEDIKFRRIRRDHPNFVHDIGRHLGGKELLIAAGFTFTDIDGIKCFFSREPDLESDMDGWSEWFNLMKNTLAAIEEEMIK